MCLPSVWSEQLRRKMRVSFIEGGTLGEEQV